VGLDIACGSAFRPVQELSIDFVPSTGQMFHQVVKLRLVLLLSLTSMICLTLGDRLRQMRHDSFKERVNHLENDHRESGQSGGLPMVLEPGTATLYPVPEIQG
jgi:hypothetical protein